MLYFQIFNFLFSYNIYIIIDIFILLKAQNTKLIQNSFKLLFLNSRNYKDNLQPLPLFGNFLKKLIRR